MNKRIVFFLTLFLLTGIPAGAQEKIPLDHTVYDQWKDLGGQVISDDGAWISYEINPGRGDGWLYLYHTVTGRLDSVARGFKASFVPGCNALVFKIKPPFKQDRKARIEKKKPDDMPGDSLGIWDLTNLTITRFPRVKSYKVAEEKSDWITFHYEKARPAKDTLKVSEEMSEEQKKEVEAEKKKIRDENRALTKAKGSELVILNLARDQFFSYPDITDYSISKAGDRISFIELTGDSITHTRVYCFETATTEVKLLFDQDGEARGVVNDRSGRQVAFIHTNDTVKTKIFSLYYWNGGETVSRKVVDTLTAGMPSGWCVSEHSPIHFSDDGTRLFFGTAPRPHPEVRDSLPEDEKVSVDVWKWDDPWIQPMQKVQADKERKRSYQAVYLLLQKKMIQLADESMEELVTIMKGNGAVAAGYAFNPYRRQITWESGRTGDVYLVDVLTGRREKVITATRSRVQLSPGGKYLYWYEPADSNWYAWSTEKKVRVNLTETIGTSFFNELMDTPEPSEPYGIAGWTKEDRYILVYDRFDIWKIDPFFREKPVNLTAASGRADTITYRYVDLDKEDEFLPLTGKIWLRGFHIYNKKSGYFTVDIGRASVPEALVYGDYSYSGLARAKNVDRLLWQRGNVAEYPELWTGNARMREERKISVTNPQQSRYLWCTVELVEWESFDRQKLQGLLYKPENFDPSKKYPMIVYFYERMSDVLHTYSSPRPLSSSLNRTYCVSNGYLFFIPDIPYTAGYPGHCAYNAVVSGTTYLVNRYPFIDRDRLGIQGHSWGGYQTAYIITRTDMFRAAEAGAPVSNMTSAYGGVRWESGMSRMFQYEESQSRIGGTLWEKPFHYIHNSPLFSANTINTPLLILHNDEDGAVPWYQGIELYMAMRRLGKPAWMLNYNGEAHGVRKWGNRVDFSIRMMQFFDHYLKDAPAPAWMEKGIPYIEKEWNRGYEPAK